MRLICVMVGVFVTWMSSLSMAAGPVPIQEGVQYQLIPGIHDKPSSSRVEVVEFFSYGCPHCYHFDSLLREWAKKSPIPIDLVQVPVTFRPGWEIYASAYYTAELFNKLGSIHEDFYKAVHEAGRAMTEPGELTSFFAAHGIPPNQFVKTIDSFGVHIKVESGAKMALNYHVISVPTLIVNKKYLTDTGLTGSYEGVLAVLDYLVQKETKKGKTLTLKK